MVTVYKLNFTNVVILTVRRTQNAQMHFHIVIRQSLESRSALHTNSILTNECSYMCYVNIYSISK